MERFKSSHTPKLLLMFVGAVLVWGFLTPSAARAWGIFDDINSGLVSIGGRATYFDPKDASGEWYGGGQVRLYLFEYLAFEGSADYRRHDFDSTRVHSYPVQVSALIYPFGTRRLSPFLLGGGGWYYTTVSGPGGLDDTQNRFGAHAGGGLQFWLNNRFSVDSTYRYIWLEKIESRDVNIKDKKFDDNGHMVTIGLNFHF
ncbi:MAG: outer membrane protein [Nitrospiraceae bacterium]